jgi:hypothetical protein
MNAQEIELVKYIADCICGILAIFGLFYFLYKMYNDL